MSWNFIFVSVFLLYVLLRPCRVDLPDHLLGHVVTELPDLLTVQDSAALRSLLHQSSPLPTNARDVDFYETLHEHIGEGRPIEEGGKCSHPLMVPNKKRTLCILPGRIDIARHYISTGGPEGLKQSVAALSSRLQSFGVYIFNPTDYPVVDELFSRPNFLAAAREVCPPHAQVLDPFQFNLIIQVPGQTVATHIDGAYFKGANRFHYPQWLLAVMKFSGLFEADFQHQVQVVAYFHDWDNLQDRDGAFVYWGDNSGTRGRVFPRPRFGSAVDGSKTVHAASLYRNGERRDPPPLDKSRDNRLTHLGGDDWAIVDGDRVLANYSYDDLRSTIVYRARCFRTEQERRDFAEGRDTVIPLDVILRRLAADLVERGLVHSVEAAMKMDRLRLAMLLLDTYTAYPDPAVSDSLVYLNYCALPKLLPWTETLLSSLC